MKAKLILLLLVSVVLVSCKDDNEKNLKNPQSLTGEALPEWMTPRIEEINNSDIGHYFYIVKAKYLTEDVYLFNNCCPMCMTAFIVYKQDGTTIENAQPALVTDSKIIWKAKGFSCNIP